MQHDQFDRESKNPQTATVNNCQECMMHPVLTCLYITVLPNHPNSEDASIQQWNASLSHIWSNSNCWGDIALWADQWLDRQTLWEIIKQRGTDSLMLCEHALGQSQETIWKLWVWQDACHMCMVFICDAEKNCFLSITDKHTSKTLLKLNILF